MPRLADLYADLGNDYEALSLDLYDVAAAEPRARGGGDVGAADRLWLCSGRLSTLEHLASLGTAAHLVHSTNHNGLGASAERHADRLADIGVEVCNMRHNEWTAGSSACSTASTCSRSWDVQEVRHLRAMLEIGIDGLCSDHVDRMVATVAEWRA